MFLLSFLEATNTWILWAATPTHNFVPSNLTASQLYREKLCMRFKILLHNLTTQVFFHIKVKHRRTTTHKVSYTLLYWCNDCNRGNKTDRKNLSNVDKLTEWSRLAGISELYNFFVVITQVSEVKTRVHTGICSHAHNAKGWKAI